MSSRTTIDIVNEHQKAVADAVEEGFRRFPGDPYRALTYVLFDASSMPRGRARFFMEKLEALRAPSPTEPPSLAARTIAMRQVIRVLCHPILTRTPEFAEAREMATRMAITVPELLDYRRKSAPW